MHLTLALLVISIGIAEGQKASCENGGFLINDTECNCPSFWTGKQCEQRLCINGGYATSDKYCVCPPGYKGIACEAALAAPSPSSTFELQDSFNLIIFNSFTDYWGMKSINKIIGSIQTVLSGSKDFQSYNYVENYIPPDDYALLVHKNDTPFERNNLIPAINSNQNLIDYLNKIFVPIKTQRYSCFTLDGFYQQISTLIRDKKLQRTTITVVTQNPPTASTNGEYEELVFLANAHQVKINVVMIEDPTFMRCDHAGGFTRSIWSLPRQTNGHTAVIQYDDSSTDTSLITNLFSLQSGYEKAFLMDLDQETNKDQEILLVVHASKVDGFKDWKQGDPILTSVAPTWDFSDSSSSTFKDLWVFNLTTKLKFGVNVTTEDDVPCSLKAYRKKADIGSIEALSSFVVQLNLDSAQTAPEAGKDTYLTLHLNTELDLTTASVNITPVNSVNRTSDPINLTRRPTTFEWISSKPFKCIDATWSSIQVRIDTIDNQTYYRTIPHLCYTYLAPTKQPKVLAVEDLDNCKGDIFLPTDPPKCFVDQTKRNNTKENIFVFGLSNTETNQFVIDPEYSLPSLNGFSRIKLIMWDKSTIVDDAEATTALAAQTLLYTTFKLDPANQIDPVKDTQLFDKLTDLANDLKEEENALIWLLLGDRLPPSNAFDNFKKTIAHRIFVNQGHRVFAFMDSNLRRNDLSTWDVNAINSLAGTTNGHFITIDKSAYGSDGSTFSNISNYFYNNIVNRRLLLAANFKDSTQVTFPTLKLATEQNNIIVTATLTMTKNGVSCLDPPVIVVGKGPAIRLQQQSNSNLWLGQGDFPVETYNMRLAGFCVDSVTGTPVGMHIRFWTEPQAVSVQYADLGMAIWSNFSLPSNDQGFAARLAIPVKSDTLTSTKATVSILQCDGTPKKFYGQTQEAISLDVSVDKNECTNSYFYPYFCQSQSPSGCPADFDGIHYAQFTINANGNTTHFTRPFVCVDSGIAPVSICQTVDRFGNNVCGGTTAPYFRGPTGKLVDCSNNGENFYKPTSDPLAYQCCCSKEFTGDSCQDGKCLEPNTRGGAVDTAYRTFNVVFGYGKNSVPAFVDTASILPNAAIPGVWLYQAFTELVGRGVVPIYIGPDFDAFKAAIQNMPFEPLNTNDTFILQNTLKQVTASLGPSPSRGLTVIHYYIDPTAYDNDNEVNAQVSATVDDSDPRQVEILYKKLQLMNQQVLVLTNFDVDLDGNRAYGQNDVLAQAALSTGGMSFMVTKEDYSFNTLKENLTTFFYKDGPAFTVNQKKMAGGETFSFYIGSDASSVLSWSATQNYALALFENSACSGDRLQNFSDIIGTYLLKEGNTYCLQTVNEAVVSIFAKDNGYGLATGFVQKWSDDQTNAVATVTTAIGPSLMVYTNPDYDFANADPATRESKRTSCTYQKVTYSLKKSDRPGYNTILLNILNKDKDVVDTRMVPFAVTASIDCMNGGVFDGDVGACQCPKEWAGIDCSIPQCFGGINGTWGTTCNCVGFASTCDQPWKALQLTTLY
ncbi:unnamed protein product, partial [Mesorhabditis belari]|uniref:EGF-like domain-containing protein n=1 Tax=Mesorhabditis belari TaxID=2138241 RepID=A0AAF3EB19_9BILA